MPGVELRQAVELTGENFNILVDDKEIDSVSGSSVMTAIPVSVQSA